MALPAGVASVRVHSEAIVDAAGNPVNGYLYLTVPQEITHAGSGMVVVPQTVKVQVTAGTFDATVVATDAAGLSLSSWTYQASEKWTGGRSFPLALPAAAPDVEYASLVPTASSAGTVMVPALVESVNGQSGAVVLTAADVGADPSGAAAAAQAAAVAASVISVYTRATKPAATGSGLVIFVSDDGVGSLYKDIAAGVWTPLNPGELAYAQNITGTATNIASGASADVPGCIITVPPCDRPVYLSAWCDVELYVGAAPALAQASIQINEISNGVDTPLALSAPYEVSSSPQWTQQALYCAPWRVGPVARNRQFKLTVASYAVAFRVLNNTAAPSYVTAEVR